jgi:uncharacterized protein YukE
LPIPEGIITMPPPSKHDVEVATDELRADGGIWLHQSDQVAAILHKADGLRLGRLEAGVFQLIVTAYDAVVDQVTARCQEGQQRLAEIGTTLRQAADTYENEDRKNEHQIRNIY